MMDQGEGEGKGTGVSKPSSPLPVLLPSAWPSLAIMQGEQAFVLHVAHPFVEIEVLDAAGVERRRAADDAVDFVAFFQQEFSEE